MLASTLNAGDQINGGAGNDTLKVIVSNSTAGVTPLAGVTVSNIEKIDVQNVGGQTSTVNLAAIAGVNTVQSTNSTNNNVFQNLAAGTTVVASGAAQTGAVSFNQLATTDAVSVAFDGRVSGVTIQATAGTATAATIASTGAANGFGVAGANTATLTGAANTLTKLTVNAATNLNATLTAADFAAAGADLVVSGAAADVRLGTNGVFKTVDASGLTAGGVTVGLSAVTTSFKGGAGNDSITAAANTITSGAVIDGGAGIDTVNALAINAGNAAVFKNFEQIDLAGFAAAAAAADNLDIALLTGSTITGAVISGAYGAGGAATLSNIAEPSTGFNLIVTDASGANAARAATLAFAASSVSGTSDALNVKFAALDQAAATTSTAGTITAARIENINIESKGGLNVSNSIGLTVNDAKSIVITGDKDLALTVTGQNAGVASTTASQLTTIDGSAATGNLNITTNGVNAVISQSALTIKGGLGNDVITVVTSATGTNTGAGASVGATVTTGAGNDTVNVSGAVARGPSFQSTTITDFQKGDSLVFANQGAEVFNATATNVSTASTLAEAVNLALAGDGSTNGIINWFTYAGNTYVVEDLSAGAVVTADDIVVKLSGVLDLSTSTFTAASDTLTFA